VLLTLLVDRVEFALLGMLRYAIGVSWEKKLFKKKERKLCQHETHKRIGWERRGEEGQS
jgi:hypothetical protein